MRFSEEKTPFPRTFTFPAWPTLQFSEVLMLTLGLRGSISPAFLPAQALLWPLAERGCPTLFGRFPAHRILCPRRCRAQKANPRVKVFPHWCLAKDIVRFVGEAVAAVVATDPYIAEDAIELIDAEFERLPVVASTNEALKQGSPLLYESWGDNVQLRYRVSGGDVEQAFADADVIVRDVIRSSRYTGTPIEPRVVIARYHAGNRSLEVWDTT